MKELKIKIQLPSEITVIMPALGDIGIEDVGHVIATTGVRLVKERIYDQVMDAFIAEQESFIKESAAELLEENRDKIKELLANTTT